MNTDRNSILSILLTLWFFSWTHVPDYRQKRLMQNFPVRNLLPGRKSETAFWTLQNNKQGSDLHWFGSSSMMSINVETLCLDEEHDKSLERKLTIICHIFSSCIPNKLPKWKWKMKCHTYSRALYCRSNRAHFWQVILQRWRLADFRVPYEFDDARVMLGCKPIGLRSYCDVSSFVPSTVFVQHISRRLHPCKSPDFSRSTKFGMKCAEARLTKIY